MNDQYHVELLYEPSSCRYCDNYAEHTTCRMINLFKIYFLCWFIRPVSLSTGRVSAAAWCSVTRRSSSGCLTSRRGWPMYALTGWEKRPENICWTCLRKLSKTACDSSTRNASKQLHRSQQSLSLLLHGHAYLQALHQWAVDSPDTICNLSQAYLSVHCGRLFHIMYRVGWPEN